MGFLFFISLLIFFFLFFMSCLKTFRVLWTNSNSVSTVQWPIPWRDCIIYSGTDYGLLMAISQILFGQYHIWDIFWLGLKTKVFCGKNNWMMEIMNKGLTVPKWGLIVVRPKIPQIPQNLFGQSAQKFEISLKKDSSGVRSPCTQPRRLLLWENCISFPAFRGWNFSSFL